MRHGISFPDHHFIVNSPIEGEVLRQYPAKMQDLNWNDLKVLLAVARSGGVAGAARTLAIDDTTVTRRLTALSRALGEDVMIRPARGRPKLTDMGRAIAEKAEEMERAADGAAIIAGHAAARVRGIVRVTATPILTNRVLAAEVGRLTDEHPELVVELIPASRNLDLIMREADLALRLARPTVGGDAVLARKIGSLPYGVYQRRGWVEAPPWIIYEAGAGGLPQAKWLAGRVRVGEAASPLRVADAETALGAALNGLGRTLLPHRIAATESRLICDTGFETPVEREVWLLSHAAHRDRPSLRAVIAWLTKILRMK